MSAVYALLLGVAAPSASTPPIELYQVPAYKTDRSWSFFRNELTCSAARAQASDNRILIMAYDAKAKAFTVGFSRLAGEPTELDNEHVFDLRVTRHGGVVDDGWEGISFFGMAMPDGSTLWTSQTMEDVALHDFSDFESIIFIDHGKTAGRFEASGNQAAVREMVSCAKQLVAKP